ncbi:MAG: hypothetical protein WC794_01370 [Candidatus Doudnabacteria bacterium]|jgi:hypothetical protein
MELDGRVSRFLERCLRNHECWYSPEQQRYEFNLTTDDISEENSLFVFPKERRVRFLQIIEDVVGSCPDGIGGERDVYETVIRCDDDRKNLSSEEAAKMIFAKLISWDFDGIVSKESLRLLK